MPLSFAALLGAVALLAESSVPATDPSAPCYTGLDETRRALAKATGERMVRNPRGSVPMHLFRGTPTGCARLRFVVDAEGRLQEPVVELAHPDTRFGAAALRLLSSAVFTPGRRPREEALMVVSFTLEAPPATD